MVKSTVKDLYVEKKTVPTCKKLLPAIREKVNVPWEEQSLRRLLHKIGFRWRKCQK
jgi:transposase